jgi:hypothetical protein
MMMVFPVMLIGFLIIGLLVAGVVILVVVLATRNKQPTAQSVAPLPSAPVTHEDRQAILKKLADGDLTKAEAEEQLAQLGSPVPETMPAPPPQGSGASKGCLIAAIIAIVLSLILLLLAAAMIFGIRIIH